jgi:hypothetical protein
VNAALRELIRSTRDRKVRERIFTTDTSDRRVLKAIYRDSAVIPSYDGAVQGINHSTWGYRHHGCRCTVCTDAMLAFERGRRERQRQRKMTDAHSATRLGASCGRQTGEA